MEYFIHIGILFFIYAILAISLNLVVGYTGLLSLAHAAFFGIGAYATAILLTEYDINFFVSAGIGMGLAGLASLFIGVVLSKFKDDYYALASLGFNVIVCSFFINLDNITGGVIGIPGIRKPSLFGLEIHSNLAYLLLSLIFFVGIFFISRFIVQSSFGRTLRAIRDDENALAVFGYKVLNFKLVIFIISAMTAAIAGSLFASHITYIDPSIFTITESVFILTIIILGGLSSLKGSLLGALFLILLPEYLRILGLPNDTAAQVRQIIYGLVLIFLMLYRPKGLIGEYEMK